mmetsp:Transcript_122397/g.346016  ORF Transcript_122397/g.346016 Transcript_122397/m.346016 type:complete len:107 (-) Transcript_122397:46-366(-)
MMMLKLLAFLVAPRVFGSMDLIFRTGALIPGAASCSPDGDESALLQDMRSSKVRPLGIGELDETLPEESLLAEDDHEESLSDDAEPLAARSDFGASSDVQSVSQKE